MAVTTTKKQEELARQTQPVQSSAPYTGLAGVSQNTANNLGNYQQGYKPGEAVTAAQQTLQQVQAQKPQSYASKYQPQLDAILQKIQNPQQFKYEFNGDNLFKAYADLYVQQGKQASLDAQGQAAGLTGGYGNSYGQNVGTQAYQQYLLKLYDRGLDLRDRAYQQYQDQLAGDRDTYNILMNADQNDYGRYRDTVGDWQRDEQLAMDRYNNERQFDYNQYADALDYYTNLARVENQDYRSDQDRQEAIRQYEQNFAYQQKTDDQKYAYNICAQILANGQMPSAELLQAAGISEPDARAMMAQMMPADMGGTGGGTSGGRGGSSKGGSEYYADIDMNGNEHYFKRDKNGHLVEVSEEEASQHDINAPWLDLKEDNYGLTSRLAGAANANAAAAIASAKPAQGLGGSAPTVGSVAGQSNVPATITPASYNTQLEKLLKQKMILK